jgi:hypothetical protein
MSLCLINQASYHEDVRGSEGTAPSFLPSALDGVCGQLHAPAALLVGKEPPVPIA